MIPSQTQTLIPVILFLTKKIYLKNVLWKWLFLWWLLLGWLITLSISRNTSHFDEFEQVKNLPYSKTPLEETGCLSNFLAYLSMSPALHPGFSDLWRSPPALSSTLTAFSCLLFLIVQAASFLIYSLFPAQFWPPLAIYS